jgi:NAD-dependent SIR2 family protein deacetylase
LGLDITPTEELDWTEDERIKLTQEGLFDTDEVRARLPLRKIPFRFHYRYECEGPHGVEQKRHLILDWEACALYWNCVRLYGEDWEAKFRQKLEDEFKQKDLMLLMGTMHRIPHQWLIVGLYYPPKALQRSQKASAPTGQTSLIDLE